VVDVGVGVGVGVLMFLTLVLCPKFGAFTVAIKSQIHLMIARKFTHLFCIAAHSF
jgi:hypothetical protein